MFTSPKPPSLDQLSVAYFCAEYGISDVLPIYSGGLGVLAGDTLQEAAALGLPFTGVGLFYKKGYFHQHTDQLGQTESSDLIDPRQVPLELMQEKNGETLLVEVLIEERTVYAQIWRFRVGQLSLYLLDTDHWRNSPADQAITDQLYAGNQHKRIQQEIVLGIGGKRALEQLGLQPTVYHLNEGHSAFLSLEILADHLRSADFPRALALTRSAVVFTNHTLLPAGNDLFPEELIRFYLGKYAFVQGIGIERLLELGAVKDQAGFFSMTMLAMRLAGSSNAVSKLHAKKATQLWPEFKLRSITNGVHLPAWVAPELQHLWDSKIPEWRSKTSNPLLWRAVRKLDPTLIWQTHQGLKKQLLQEVFARTGTQLSQDILTVVWARRFTPYKRPDLFFADLEKLKKLLFHEERPLQLIISGKSHPADTQGKAILRHIEALSENSLKSRVVFVNDYSISLATALVSGADVWLNTPIFGLEASGTSGMKASVNGVVQCTIPDGWANEVDWRGIGFTLPIQKAEQEIYSLFERRIIPTYYQKNSKGTPELWTHLMRETIATISPRFCSQRMLEEYIHQLYLPALQSFLPQK